MTGHWEKRKMTVGRKKRRKRKRKRKRKKKKKREKAQERLENTTVYIDNLPPSPSLSLYVMPWDT